MRRKYRGIFGRRARKRCPHIGVRGVYGDEILWTGGWRLFCTDCGKYLDGTVKIATLRELERGVNRG